MANENTKTVSKKASKETKTQVGFVSALVDKYGSVTVSIATLIIAIVFCLWFTTRQMNWMQRQFETAQQQTHTEMVQIIKSTVDESVTYALNERDREHNEQSMLRLENSPRVNAELKKFLVDIDCDHISICEYHNGYQNIITSLPFCRYSVTYEASRAGHRYVSSDFQSASISPILTMCEPGQVLHLSTQDVKEYDDYIYYYMNQDGVKEIYLCPIMSDGKPCGVIICANYRVRESNQEKIKQLSRDIAVYLHIS